MSSIEDITAAVINPFNQNIVMNVSRNTPEEQKPQLTEAQFHAVIRQQMESRVFPHKIHTEGETYIEDLCKRQGECIVELFEDHMQKQKIVRIVQMIMTYDIKYQ